MHTIISIAKNKEKGKIKNLKFHTNNQAVMLGKIYVIYIRIHKIKYEYDANHQLNLIKFVAWSHICT